MLKPGDPAPDFELLDQHENAVKLSELISTVPGAGSGTTS